ncbi:Sperm receptor for egg jelly [Holothuria leucospilota]|uniref:Sperm receptor for egg jelly n=1 Tax=Holothuria leucospilota TaxID=206669 RepID=A0A9Q1CCV6_HOLLE|nr:Sperm receptor for egg jelly [Holothuria leucospilota]
MELCTRKCSFYPSLNLLIYQKKRGVILSAVKSMETIQDTLLTKKVPGERATSITTASFVLSVSKQTASNLIEMQDISSTKSGSFQLPNDVTFYQNVTTKNNQMNGVIDIQVTDIPVNPFSSNFDESEVVTSGIMGLKLKTNEDEITGGH